MVLCEIQIYFSMIIFIVLKYAYATRSSKCDMLFCIYIYIVIESQVVKNLPINRWDSGDVGLIPRWERFPGEGNDNPLQYSKLENSRDRGALQATLQRGCEDSDTAER